MNLPCPHCQSPLDDIELFVGQDVACPACGFQFHVHPPQAAAPQQPQWSEEDWRLAERIQRSNRLLFWGLCATACVWAVLCFLIWGWCFLLATGNPFANDFEDLFNYSFNMAIPYVLAVTGFAAFFAILVAVLTRLRG